MFGSIKLSRSERFVSMTEDERMVMSCDMRLIRLTFERLSLDTSITVTFLGSMELSLKNSLCSLLMSSTGMPLAFASFELYKASIPAEMIWLVFRSVAAESTDYRCKFCQSSCGRSGP